MPTQAYFDRFPRFPNDVPVMNLPKLKYDKLLQKHAMELETLYEAAINHGFFFLDFIDTPSGPELLRDVVKALDIGQPFLDMKVEKKREFQLTSATIGYV